ncbi:MAG: sigma-70 family RNA polymerase sigma factor [Myxococcales bacterium]|nr:sigma-70 family RNA polymerase sigma factor [Myxococcales bacterium]
MGSAAAVAAADGAPADSEIVKRAQAGDHDAFRILVDRYQGRAYGLALRILRNEEQAKDAVQDSFLKVYRSLDRFEGRAGFYTWLYRIVMNQCLDRKRRDKSDREVEWNDESAAGVLNASESAASPAGRDADREAPDVAIERSEIRQAVARAINALPEDARRTIQLREIDGLSYKEIAEAMGIPKGTVMSRLHYARQRLRELLQEAGIDPTAAGDGTEDTT